MDITHRTATVTETATPANGITGTLPSDAQAGDLFIAVFAGDSLDTAVTGPSGWTPLVAPIDEPGQNITLAVYRRWGASTGPVISTSGAAGYWTCIVHALGGADPTDPIDAAAVTNVVTSATTATAGGVTTLTAGAVLMSAVVANTRSRVFATPSGMTMIRQYGAATQGRACALAGETRATAGATGTRTWAFTTTPPALSFVTAAWAIRPAGGSVTGDVSQAVTAAATTTAIVSARGAASPSVAAGTTAAATIRTTGAASSAITAGAEAAGSTGSGVTPVQMSSATSATNSTSVTATFTAATAGNLLWAACAMDKSAGTITAPSGWTTVLSSVSTSVSTWVGRKVAVGGETSVTVSRSAASSSGDTLWVGEYAHPGAGAWQVLTSATHATDETSVTSWSTGTAAAPSSSCAAIGFWAIDSASSSTGSETITGSWVAVRDWDAALDGAADVAVAWLANAPAGSSQECTRSWTGADQVSAAVATFSRVGVVGAATATSTAAAAAGGRIGAVGAAAAAETAGTSAGALLAARAAATGATVAATTAAGWVGATGGATAAVTAAVTAAGDPQAPDFPLSPLPISMYAWLGGVRTDITPWVYGRDSTPISITRGRTSEGATVERQTMTFQLDNRDGRWSPRNPTGPYYGLLGRNTPVALEIREGGPYLLVPGTSGARVATPDSARLALPGDLDVCVDVDGDDWTQPGDLIGQWEIADGKRSWQLLISTGFITFYWSQNGTSYQYVNSTVSVPMDGPGRLAIRAILDVDNGAGGWTVTFFTAATISGPWRQLGSAVSGSGTTSIYHTSVNLCIGDLANAGLDHAFGGKYYSAEVRSGVDGTFVANPVFSDQILGAGVFFDDQGNTWSVSNGVQLTNAQTRFVGEIAEWPPKWDQSGRDVWVPATASGVMRRLGQGASPVQSALRSALPSLPNLVAYWPCEEGSNAQIITAASDGANPMVVSGEPKFADDSVFVASGPLPRMKTARFDGLVSKVGAAGEVQVRFLIHVPDSGVTGTALQICRVYTTGTAAKWSVEYETSESGRGNLRVRVSSSDDTEIAASSWVYFGMDGKARRLGLTMYQSGSNVNWELTTLDVGYSVGSIISGAVNGRTVGAFRRIVIGKHNDLADMAIGHVTVENDATSVFSTDRQLNAYRYETAGQRISRLCEENRETFTVIGSLNDTVKMGYQKQRTFLALIQECAAADGGVLYEPRDQIGIVYRTRASVERQNPTVTLSYSGHQMTRLEPTEDDRATRNLVKVTREDGASSSAELTDGALSTQPPPGGIGRYDTAVTLNIADDRDAVHHAHWRLLLGTVDEQRVPAVQVDLASPHLAGDQGLVRDILSLDVGSRVDITDPPPWMPPDDISQIVQGYTEKIGQFLHQITLSLAPASPYRVAIYDDDLTRYSSDGSVLAADVTSSATTLSVATASGPLWSHVDGDFDVIVGGERMTVTAVSGVSSPQT
ncbi:MAG: hypothetical protein QG671_3591, partial [Actinomycetota bacterium]|nr:hypothetical protein [Actinomycetota bacterium]